VVGSLPRLPRGTKTASHPETQTSIPNEPFVLNTDTKAVADFLNKELACPVIDELLPHMPFVARKSGVHIDPLHEHLLKGRTVKITENPGLHLVWYYKELYVKPLPQCLFSYGFWEKHLTSRSKAPTNRQSVALLSDLSAPMLISFAMNRIFGIVMAGTQYSPANNLVSRVYLWPKG
jgi:hypothetical protein